MRHPSSTPRSDISARTRVAVADPHPIFREGLKGLLGARGFAVVGEASDECEAIRLATVSRPDLLLLGLAIPRSSSFEDTLANLAVSAPEVRTIIIASRDDPNAAIMALQRGARGVLLKEASVESLFDGIDSVLQDKFWVHGDNPSEMVQLIRRLAARAEAETKKSSRFGLTRRELEIVEGVVMGESNREIGRRLSVREDTVKHHLSNVFDKLGVFSRVELAVFAINQGLVSNETEPTAGARAS